MSFIFLCTTSTTTKQVRSGGVWRSLDSLSLCGRWNEGWDRELNGKWDSSGGNKTSTDAYDGLRRYESYSHLTPHLPLPRVTNLLGFWTRGPRSSHRGRAGLRRKVLVYVLVSEPTIVRKWFSSHFRRWRKVTFTFSLKPSVRNVYSKQKGRSIIAYRFNPTIVKSTQWVPSPICKRVMNNSYHTEK